MCVSHARVLKASGTTPQAPPPPQRGRRGAAEAVLALELPSESCALGRGASAQGNPPHGAVLSVASGRHRGHGARGAAGGSCEPLAGSRGWPGEGREARAPPPPGQGEQPALGTEGGMSGGGTVSPGLGCGPWKPQGFTWKVPEPLESVVSRGPGVRLGPPSWQTPAD